MVDPQTPNSNPAFLRIAMRVLLLFGLCAMAYVILQSCSSPKQDLHRFSKGALKKLEVLDPAPAQPTRTFTGPGTGPDGKTVSLRDFRGQYVLLNIWATWCAPCVAEIPSLDMLQASKPDANLKVVAVAMERHRVDAESFYKTIGVQHLDLYSDESLSIAADVGVQGLPISIFYDPSGKEIARIAGEVDWQSQDVEDFLGTILARD